MNPYKVLGESRTPGPFTVILIKAGHYTMII